jgi:hypothetical protein
MLRAAFAALRAPAKPGLALASIDRQSIKRALNILQAAVRIGLTTIRIGCRA